MVKICPISERNVNENVSRLNSFFTLLFAGLFIASGSFWFLCVLLIDFLLRLLNEGKLSPVIRLSTYLLDILKARKVLINAGPKIFASRIGLMLSVASFVFLIAGFPIAAAITAGILAFFSFLEFAFGLCVACKIYPYALVLNDFFPGKSK